MSNETAKEPVFINNQSLDYMYQFTYLGSVVSISGGTEEDLRHAWGKQDLPSYGRSLCGSPMPTAAHTSLVYTKQRPTRAIIWSQMLENDCKRSR